MSEIKQRRLESQLSIRPGLEYLGGQDRIVHLEADLHEAVAWAERHGRCWAFTLSNAGAYYFKDRCDLSQLGEIDWNAVQARQWQGQSEGKQAEFLMERSFPWSLVRRIGVLDPGVYNMPWSIDRFGNQMQSMNTSHQELLAQVGRIYERHGQTERRKRQFNIFTTLRKSSDEVNLHSRFLHALLNHREPTDDQRRNLEDFLANVADIKCFPVDGVNVHREFDNIDLLIENVQQKQAVVIENKIWSDDQDQQLQRYHKALGKL